MALCRLTGSGISVPLVKDKLAIISSPDNRVIYIAPVIFKLFEMVVLDICSNFLKLQISLSLVLRIILVMLMLFLH